VEAQLRVEEGPGAGTVHVVRAGQTRTLGRRPLAELHLDDPAVAGRHAGLRVEADRCLVVDLGAPAGTIVEGAAGATRLAPHAPRELQDGEALRLGAVVLRVELVGDDGRPVPRRSAPRPAAALPAGYELVRELGRGAAGVVLAARRQRDGRPVAVKLLLERVEPGSPDHERFLREGRLAAGLKSPHLVELLDAQVTPAGQPYLVLELVPGGSVEALLRARGPLPVAEALRLAGQVASALAVAAAAGVVHRDVKPANILLGPDGAAKLGDFGIARSLEATARSLTVSGQGLGTMAYMPPEQVAEAKHVDPRADLYALGATLYHLLAGRPPFQPTTLEELYATVDTAPPPLASLRPDVPPAVATLVHGLLAKDPFERRPPNARTLVQALAALARGVA
jgi:serine/threonine protein kinase